MSRTAAAALIVAVSLAATLEAVSTFAGLEPGKSTRGEFEKIFGASIRAVSASRLAYAPRSGAASIEVEYEDLVIDRIDIGFDPAREASDALRKLGVSEATARATRGGRVVDYFGGSRTLVVTHQSADPASAIITVSYLSTATFDRAIAGLTQSVNTAPPSTAVQLANPADAPVILQLNPKACSELYLWAQQEHEVVKRAKNAARRIAILDIIVASQRGDCARAGKLAEAYRKQYK